VLSSCEWPMLRRLAVRFSCCVDEPREADIATVVQNLRQWLSPRAVPVLAALSYNAEECHGDICACTVLNCPPLSGLRALTELDLNWHIGHKCSVLDFLRMVGADAMPLLRRLKFSGLLSAADVVGEFPASAADEELGAIALIQRMPLTALHLAHGGNGIDPLLHHLPQLRELCCGDDEPCAVSIAAAPHLQKLQVSTYVDALSIAKEWWRHAGCPPLRTDQQLSQALEPVAAAPPLRELIIEHYTESLPADVFPYLTHLPHLRVLECTLRMPELAELGVLPQLEELRLWPAQLGYFEYETWSDAGLRTLGGLPLPRLHSLCLNNKEERGSESRFDDEWIRTADPDFPWDERSGPFGVRWERAALQTGVTLDGLRALLQLPALTVLDLPWIEDRVLCDFSQHAQRHGRTSLRIDRPVPLSRRSLLERHWLRVDQLGIED